MNQKDDNLKFKRKIPNNYIKPDDSQNIMANLKIKLMDKYDISPQEADKVLRIIENKERKNNKNLVSEKEHSISNNKNNESHKSSGVDNNQKINNNLGNQENLNNHYQLNNNSEVLINKKEKIHSPMENKKNIQKESSNKNNSQNENVDSILGDIIHNYNQQISIDVSHVDLTFEVNNEKIDTLKETFIRTLKRNKTKKIKIHALKDVSFQIYKGEKVGIIGYNGAGKSTLLNVITGIYPPDNGTVNTYGKISPLLSLGAGFDHNFSGRKNIILNGAVLGYDKDFLESKIDEIIEFSELGEYIDVPIKNYSSGMLAKLGFSIATSVNPDILIIDEILGVGDVNFKKKSADKMRSLMDGGTTVLLVSHSIPQIRELCDKAIWIDKGSIRAIGEVNKICDEYLKDAEKASNEQLVNIQLIN